MAKRVRISACRTTQPKDQMLTWQWRIGADQQALHAGLSRRAVIANAAGRAGLNRSQSRDLWFKLLKEMRVTDVSGSKAR